LSTKWETFESLSPFYFLNTCDSFIF